LEISGSSFVENGDGGVDEGGGDVDASSGPQPLIHACAFYNFCNPDYVGGYRNYTCAEYLGAGVTVQKKSIQAQCLTETLSEMELHDATFYNLPEGVTTVEADSFLLADLCPAECSGVVSQVKSPMCVTNTITQ
jgi:hypothetical protein